VISERLGHSTAAFTLQTYTHVIPGMDQDAADTVAKLILARPIVEAEIEADGSILGSIEANEGPGESEEPADLERFRRSAGSSASSGGSVLVHDIPDTCWSHDMPD
jgi:hypothetical protein